MTPQGVRRSGRIAKEIAILLMGSDTEGKVFSEQTKTVVLSRHGAGLVSRHKLGAEEEITIRILQDGKETQARVVGQMGSQSGLHTYGVAFLDDSLSFWDVDFPPPLADQDQPAPILLACVVCGEHAKVGLSELEADVYAVNDGIIRNCTICGYSTIWKCTTNGVPKPPKPATVNLPLPVTVTTPVPSPSPAPAPMQGDAEAPSAYSSATIVDLADFSHAPEPEPAEPLTPAATNAPRANRRKYVRAKVTVAACIRSEDFGEDIAVCEDMSRGGIRFKSRKQYQKGSAIEVAAPFSSETQNIFVNAKIVFVQKIADQDFFRYGVAYLSHSKNEVKNSVVF